MRRCLLLLLVTGAATADAQSLYLRRGARGVETSVGWSVGPFSQGVEAHVGVGLGGRFDVGVGVGRYTYTPDDASSSTFDEVAPFVRYLPVRQLDGAPVSLSLNAQLFVDAYDGDDTGGYLQAGTTLTRTVSLSERFAVQPFVGFAFVAESYTFGGATDRDQYLTRDVGLHFAASLEPSWLVRVTLAEQAFRRETYRAARLALIAHL